MKHALLLLLVLTIAISCKKENQLEKEISNINIDISVERFDKLFAEFSVNELPKLKKAYPFMFSKKYDDSYWIAKKEDTLQQQLYNEVAKEFQNFDAIETEIESLFNHLKYYFPEFNPPRVITSLSDVDYRNKVLVTDTIALISIDTSSNAEKNKRTCSLINSISTLE